MSSSCASSAGTPGPAVCASVAEPTLSRSLIKGGEGLFFVAVPEAVVVFECTWPARSGTSALIHTSRPDPR